MTFMGWKLSTVIIIRTPCYRIVLIIFLFSFARKWEYIALRMTPGYLPEPVWHHPPDS